MINIEPILVRNKFIEQQEKEGNKCTYFHATGSELEMYRKFALVNSIRDYMNHDTIESLMDIDELIQTIIESKGMKYYDFRADCHSRNVSDGTYSYGMLVSKIEFVEIGGGI